MKVAIIGFFVSILFTSCSTPVQLPRDVSVEKTILLPFRIDSIAFVDRRPDTLTYEMKLPVISAKSREWIVKPGLANQLREEIRGLINKTSNPEGFPSFVTVYIVEGYYKISGSATKVGEHARFDCELEFRLFNTNGYYRTTAIASHDFEGLFNATEKHVKDVYKITVRNSVFNALKQAERAFDK